MLEIKNLFKKYKKYNILNSVNLLLPSKGLVFLTGENGTGKTTLLNILTLNDSKFKGELLFDGIAVSSFTSRKKQLFKKNNIGNLRFDAQIRFGEDTIFVLNYLGRIHSCYISDKLFYIYHPSQLATFSKYKLSINEFFYILHRILETYRESDMHSMDFEKRIFYWFSLYRGNLKEKDLYLWYKNPDVLWMYKRLKKSFGWEYRIKYNLMSIPIVARIKRFMASNNIIGHV